MCSVSPDCWLVCRATLPSLGAQHVFQTGLQSVVVGPVCPACLPSLCSQHGCQSCVPSWLASPVCTTWLPSLFAQSVLPACWSNMFGRLVCQACLPGSFAKALGQACFAQPDGKACLPGSFVQSGCPARLSGHLARPVCATGNGVARSFGSGFVHGLEDGCKVGRVFKRMVLEL
jgi:hypothetical protein